MVRRPGVICLSLAVLLSLVVSGCLSSERPATPIADIEAPASGIAGMPLDLSAANSSSPRDPLVVYLWDFGDGHGATGERVRHSYRDEGLYTIRLVVVTDEGGAHSTDRIIEILMPNTPPVAIIEGPEEGEVGRNLTFDARHSFDNDGNPLTYLWSFGDGANSTAKRAGHIFTEPDTYKVKLTVTDSRQASATTSLEVVISLRQYRVNWDFIHQSIIDDDFYLAQGQDATISRDLPSNLTSLYVNLTWTDDSQVIPLTQDTFTLEVDGAGGNFRTAQENDGDIRFQFGPLNDEPTVVIYLEAYDLSDLYQRLQTLVQGSQGQGSWAVTVTLDEALPDFPVDSDTGNDYHLDLEFLRYRAIVKEVGD